MSFDLFERTAEGPIWIECHKSQEDARLRMKKIAAIRRVHVLLYSVAHGTFVDEARPI